MKRLHNFNSYNKVNEAKGGEIKIKDITDAYEEKEKELEKAKNDLKKAQENFNEIYTNASKEGDNLIKQYKNELLDKLKNKLNVYRVFDYNSLVELLVDNSNGKISFHNRKYLDNLNGKYTFMIRNEETLDAYEGKLKEDFTPKEAAEYIFEQIKKFKEKYNFGIKWFK